MLGAPQDTASAQPQTLPIDNLKSYPNHKYELYTGEKLAAMVESIKEHGIIQPVIVWHKDGEYKLKLRRYDAPSYKSTVIG